MTVFWMQFLEWFASVSALIAVLMTITQMHSNRTHYAALHYISQCDAALANPHFSSPELGKIDLRDRTFDGKKTEFERYEWFVARLVYSLDAAMRLAPFQQWQAVAATQLANHGHYFSSDYYAKQNYLKHYSPRMRRMIQQQRAA